MLHETRQYGIPATLRGLVNNDMRTTTDAVLQTGEGWRDRRRAD